MMMGMSKLSVVFAIVHTVALLTVSFFVLVVAKKVEGKALKIFGYIIAVLLWIAAGSVFVTGIWTLSKGGCTNCPKMSMQHRMMQPPVMPNMPENMPPDVSEQQRQSKGFPQ